MSLFPMAGNLLIYKVLTLEFFHKFEINVSLQKTSSVIKHFFSFLNNTFFLDYMYVYVIFFRLCACHTCLCEIVVTIEIIRFECIGL